jgi:hypothetical protein
MQLPSRPLQAQEVAAILLGYPGTTQDVDIFPAKSAENGERMVAAILKLGFLLDDNTQAEIIRGKDFIQLKDGPFDRPPLTVRIR